MIRSLALLLVSTSIARCENSLNSHERKEGFELLYDGKTLTKWHSIKLRPDAGAWKGRKGILTWEKGGSWLATCKSWAAPQASAFTRLRATNSSG